MMKQENRKYLIDLVGKVWSLKLYSIPLIVFTLFSILSLLIFNNEAYRKLVQEDGIVEWLTFVFLLMASVFFLLGFLKYRSIFFLLFSILFVFGAMEEISWGQRVFRFNTPEIIYKENVQKEFNLHNLEIFNSSTFEGVEKSLLMKFLDANNLFKLFALFYCVLIPLLSDNSEKIAAFLRKIRLPVPPLAIGIFIFINLCILYFYKFFITPASLTYTTNYYIELWEMMGTMTFLSASIYFFFNDDLGENTIRQNSN
jgi:hypothetical protein